VTLTAKDVAEITRLLEESSFDELHLELDGMKLTLRRGPSGTVGTAPAGAPREPDASTRRAAPAPAKPAPAAPTPTTAAPVDPGVHTVPAPLLGTFYRAPKPGAPPFVEVGAMVEEETIICIIEVMKLMNTVRAGVRGRVSEILARDGALVEYGEALLRVSPSS
jgi:acetyl-CoA carboxylase biotin carboxyl carrier protein